MSYLNYSLSTNDAQLNEKIIRQQIKDFVAILPKLSGWWLMKLTYLVKALRYLSKKLDKDDPGYRVPALVALTNHTFRGSDGKPKLGAIRAYMAEVFFEATTTTGRKLKYCDAWKHLGSETSRRFPRAMKEVNRESIALIRRLRGTKLAHPGNCFFAEIGKLYDSDGVFREIYQNGVLAEDNQLVHIFKTCFDELLQSVDATIANKVSAYAAAEYENLKNSISEGIPRCKNRREAIALTRGKAVEFRDTIVRMTAVNKEALDKIIRKYFLPVQGKKAKKLRWHCDAWISPPEGFE